LSYVMNPRVAVTMKREREMNASTTAGLYWNARCLRNCTTIPLSALHWHE
jgi:hypothetical protein